MTFSPAMKILLQGMLRVNPNERFTIQDIKESVWYKKQNRLTDYKYRHYMHEIYKKRKPHCNSKTPGSGEIVNKAGPRSEHPNCISRKAKICRNANGQLISLSTLGPQKSIRKAIADMRGRGSNLEQKDVSLKNIRDSLPQKKKEVGVRTPSEKTPVLNADDIHQFHVSPDNESDDGYFTSKYIVQCLRLATRPAPIREGEDSSCFDDSAEQKKTHHDGKFSTEINGHVKPYFQGKNGPPQIVVSFTIC